MKRWLFTIGLTAALFFVVQHRFVLEDDPVRSLRQQDSHAARVFDRYHEHSVFQGKVFIDFAGIGDKDARELERLLAEAHYVPTRMIEPPAPETMLALLPLIPAETLRQSLSDEAVDARSQEALSFALLPGGAGYLAQVEKDPFGLGPRFLQQTMKSLGFSAASAGNEQLRIYKSPTPISYDQVGRVYDKLISLGPNVRFIGGDFFAYENYKAAQRDVMVCSTLTLAINLLLFLFFTRRFRPMLILGVGSVFSYLTGVLAVGFFYDSISAVVLAFTSTFVGYNNEYLVHLSALPQGTRKKSLLGVWSAVGTTLIGFIVLLFGHSVLVRQMALASLGGMAGFLAVLLIFRKALGEVRFRTFQWPKLSVGPKVLIGVAAGTAALLVLLPWPRITTNVEELRSQSPILEEQTRHFSDKLGEASLANVVAVPVEGDVVSTVSALGASGRFVTDRHPLAIWRSVPEQAESIDFLRARYPEAVARLRASLEEAGLSLSLNADLASSLAPLDAWSFLQKLNGLAPAKWAEEVDGTRYVFVSARKDADLGTGKGQIVMSPRYYFDTLLTGLSRELAVLFALGLVAMCIYLVVLHRRPLQVLYVFVPLMLSALAFLAYSLAGTGQMSIVHFVGFSLVIALATDYPSVAVASDHHEVEMSKILLTSLSTLATFGILLVAKQPVLRDLGVTVTIGCVVSSLIALFVKPSFEASEPEEAGKAEKAEGAVE